MTAFSKVSNGRFSGDGNVKDGHLPALNPFGFWGVAGFMPISPCQWVYTNKRIIGCPVFEVVETASQIIATLDGEATETFGPTDHREVKRWLDDQILIVKIFEADVEAPLDWQPAGIEIDAFMATS